MIQDVARVCENAGSRSPDDRKTKETKGASVNADGSKTKPSRTHQTRRPQRKMSGRQRKRCAGPAHGTSTTNWCHRGSEEMEVRGQKLSHKWGKKQSKEIPIGVAEGCGTSEDAHRRQLTAINVTLKTRNGKNKEEPMRKVPVRGRQRLTTEKSEEEQKEWGDSTSKNGNRTKGQRQGEAGPREDARDNTHKAEAPRTRIDLIAKKKQESGKYAKGTPYG